MSVKQLNWLSRRSFIRGASVLGSGSFLAADRGDAKNATATLALPQRTLGKTNQRVSALALGTWPCGRCRDVDTAAVSRLVNEALDRGINFVDTANNYGKAEDGIGRALGTRRDEVFLTTKVWADDAQAAKESFEQSLRALQTDHVDLVYLHSVGNRDVEKALSDDGALTYLLRQKQAGKTRFVGISGHSRVKTFVPIIESGQIDVVMMAMNFVDRHIYGFEKEVLPVAIKHNVGVACMKVFGGIRGGFAAANGPNPGPQMDPRFMRQAVRYAMGLPGVATLVIGPHTIDQLRQNVDLVSSYEPMTEDETEELTAVGKRLAGNWGEHYGPVA